MQMISSSEARNNLAAILEKAQHEPITIQKQGRNAAVLLSYEEYERLTSDPTKRFHALCERIRRNAEERGLTDEKFNAIMAEDIVVEDDA